MAARAAQGYPSPTSVTLGRHSEPLVARQHTDAHGRPTVSPGRSSVPLGGSAHTHQPQPQRRPSPPPLVRTDHVARAAAADPRADLRIDARGLDPRAHPPPGHPYYASAARPAVTPPGHRAGPATGPPPGLPPPTRPPGHHHQHPYQSQPVPAPRAASRPHQPESSSSRPKHLHHLSHTTSAALPPPPPASSSRGPPSGASDPPPAHAHQPKVLRMPEQEEDQPLDLGAPTKRRASPDVIAEGQPTSKSMKPEETKPTGEQERSDPSGSSNQKVRTSSSLCFKISSSSQYFLELRSRQFIYSISTRPYT